jgi:hypothetical protein
MLARGGRERFEAATGGDGHFPMRGCIVFMDGEPRKRSGCCSCLQFRHQLSHLLDVLSLGGGLQLFLGADEFTDSRRELPPEASALLTKVEHGPS